VAWNYTTWFDVAFLSMRGTFAALADRVRLKILYALKDGEELSPCGNTLATEVT
jgi:hypothetical protein